MRLFGRGKSVLDEREMQDLYRVEHRGLWLTIALLCAAVVVQLLLGAAFAQVAGELFVIGATSLAMIVAYARRGIWDANSRPSLRGNAAYAAVSSACMALIAFGRSRSLAFSLATAACMFVVCFLLLALLMAVVDRRRKESERELEEE